MSTPDTPTHPAHCTHCTKLTPEGACEIWLRVTGENTISTETLSSCRMCGWKDCVVVYVTRKSLPQSGPTGDYATALEGK